MRNQFSSPRRALSLRGLACLASVLLVAACVGDASEHWSPQEAPKENKVTWITFDHEVAFTSSASSLSQTERAKISRFLDEIDLGNSDHVFIRANRGPGNHQVAAVAKHLRTMRVKAEIIVARGAVRPVSVVVGRYLVTPPRCPDWTKQPGLDIANRRSSNFGCATTSNLGLMVADPGDLVHGAPMGPSDGEKGATAINKYRNDKVEAPPTVTLSVQGGK
jgi:pilus assembly protein CpaD